MRHPIEGEGDPHDYDESRSRQMYFKSKIEEANYREITGRIVPIDHIIAYLESVGSRLRQGLSQLPDRLAPRLCHESDEMTIHRLMMDEITELSSDIESMFDSKEAINQLKQVRVKQPLIKGGKVSSYHL